MCFFNQSKPQQATPPPPIVDTNNTSNQAFVDAATAAKQKAALAEGQGSTVLTSPLGDQSKATTSNKQLLGQ